MHEQLQHHRVAGTRARNRHRRVEAGVSVRLERLACPSPPHERAGAAASPATRARRCGGDGWLLVFAWRGRGGNHIVASQAHRDPRAADAALARLPLLPRTAPPTLRAPPSGAGHPPRQPRAADAQHADVQAGSRRACCAKMPARSSRRAGRWTTCHDLSPLVSGGIASPPPRNPAGRGRRSDARGTLAASTRRDVRARGPGPPPPSRAHPGAPSPPDEAARRKTTLARDEPRRRRAPARAAVRRRLSALEAPARGLATGAASTRIGGVRGATAPGRHPTRGATRPRLGADAAARRAARASPPSSRRWAIT